MGMDTLQTLLMALLVLNGLGLGGLIMLQQGRGADVGAAFGSGAANTVFGSQGSGSFLTKLTTWLAISFFAVTFGLAYLAKERAQSLGDVGLPEAVQAPLDFEIPALDGGGRPTGEPGTGASAAGEPASGAPVDSDIPLVD